MKINKKKIYITSTFVVIAVAVFIGIFATSNKNENVASEKIVVNELSERSFYELIDEINSFEPELEDTVLIYYGEALTNATKDATLEEIEKEIANTDNCTTLRVLLLQICDDLDIKPNEDLLNSLINDEKSDFEIKRNSMYLLDNSDKADELIKIARGDDDRLAFHAIKELMGEAPMKAGEIADEILAAYDGTFTFKTRGAVIAKAKALKQMPDAEETDKFIEICDKILQEHYADEDQSAVYMIMDAFKYHRHEKYLYYVLDCELLNTIQKDYCISSYTEELLAITNKDMSEKQLSYVITAMEINPQQELFEPLQEIAESYSFSGDDETLETRLQDVLSRIEAEK